MRLGAQIRLFVLLTGVVPLAVLALAASRIAVAEIAASLTREQVSTASQLAVSLGSALGDQERVIAAQFGNFRLDAAPDEARTAFLVSAWRLFPEVAIARLADAGGGDAVPPIFATSHEESQGHDVVNAQRLAEFRAALPDPGPGVVRGLPYLPAGSGAAVVPVVFPSPWRDGMTLGVELSLRPMNAMLQAVAGADRAVFLVDPNGKVLLAAGRSELVDPSRLAPLLRSAAADARVDEQVVVATSQLPGRDLVVVVAAPASNADAVLQRILQPTWYIGLVSLLAAAAAGTLLGRSIAQPVLGLAAAAHDVGQGNLDRRVPAEGGNEITELAISFNQMTAALKDNRDEIAAKNVEIEAFSRELQARVDERSRQLREAQARLVQTSQLAAVAEMSAGLAHELNNPMAGLLGMVQLVKARRDGTPDAALLGAAEAEALRCKEIIASLLRFTAAPRPAGEREAVVLSSVLADIASLAGSSFRQRSVALVFSPGPPIRVLAQPDELGRALSGVLGALRTAAAPGGTVRVSMPAASDPTTVELRFDIDHLHDSQDDWRAASLGLWAARRTLGAEGWSIEEVPTEQGKAWRATVARVAEPA